MAVNQFALISSLRIVGLLINVYWRKSANRVDSYVSLGEIDRVIRLRVNLCDLGKLAGFSSIFIYDRVIIKVIVPQSISIN